MIHLLEDFLIDVYIFLPYIFHALVIIIVLGHGYFENVILIKSVLDRVKSILKDFLVVCRVQDHYELLNILLRVIIYTFLVQAR